MPRSLATIGTRARALAIMAGRGLMSVLLLLTVAAVAVTFLPGLLGYQRYVLVGSSMEPTIHRGSLVFDEVVPVAQLRKGDVITYVPPGRSQPVTHRLISVKHPKQLKGRALFRTQGDNVPDPDMRPFTLDKPTQARYSFAVPYLGWVFIGLGTPQMRLFLLVVPALLIALAMVARLWREGGRLAAERAQLAAAAEHEAA
jgi:signal peptidase I